MRRDIVLDRVNQFVIIGRNPTGLLLSQDEIYELEYSERDGIIRFGLKRTFEK